MPDVLEPGGYGTAALAYLAAGWSGVLPLPYQAKKVPPKGTTGRAGLDPTPEQVRSWCSEHPDGNIALRMPRGSGDEFAVVGIDVDDYDEKSGGQTLVDREAEWGPLPPTIVSTSRDGISGVRLFRAPADRIWHDVGQDVETIWWGHRYLVVWPSIHPDTGAMYRFVDQRTGEVLSSPPAAADLPLLPDAWVTGLTAVTRKQSEKHPRTRSKWTSPDVGQLARDGIPNDRPQDETLRDLVWELRRRGHDRATARAVWWSVIQRSSQTKAEPWGEDDFARHWSGADRKIGGLSASTSGQAWDPVDFGDWFENPPEPVERVCSGRLLYRGATHWIAGEPESGKSVLAYSWAVESMRRGEHVLILDEEAARRDVFDKMTALGADRDLLKRWLTYLEPAGRDLLQDAERLLALATRLAPTLVIIDSAAAHLAIADLDEDRAPDVTKFMVNAILPLAHQLGSTVVVIDHKTKASSDSRYARGSGAKLAKTDVAFNVSAPEPFSKARSGRVRIECTKDRLGDIGRGHIVEVEVVTDGTGRIQMRWRELADDEVLAIRANSERLRDRRTRVDVVRRDAILTILQSDLFGLRTGAILTAVKKLEGFERTDRTRISKLLNQMETEGLVRHIAEGRNVRRWEIIR